MWRVAQLLLVQACHVLVGFIHKRNSKRTVLKTSLSKLQGLAQAAQILHWEILHLNRTFPGWSLETSLLVYHLGSSHILFLLRSRKIQLIVLWIEWFPR